MTLRSLGITLAVLLALAGLYLLVDHLVVTDAERIDALVRACARAAESRDPAALLAHATENCEIDGLRGEGPLRDLLAALFADFKELTVTVDRVTTEVTPARDRATGIIAATVTASFAELSASGTFLLSLRAHYARTGECWLVERVEKAEMKSLLEERFGR